MLSIGRIGFYDEMNTTVFQGSVSVLNTYLVLFKSVSTMLMRMEKL